jgi:transposase
MRVIAKRYTDEFRLDALNLIHQGERSFRQLSDDLGVSVFTLRRWYNLEQMAKKKPKKVTAAELTKPRDESAEQQLARLEREVSRLTRENETLRTDREILKKAAAFFAKESE